ncbi:C-C motif chemokine 4-like [Eublepharis macularius]|uniref:C-C motif chemokine n=1 Tax=Eublepharis macularius TaxID=481883 RepID=A0AA97KJP8_EUBMA|nr:C-C motif chemokine 4-like [Eublepharis macularius]
MKVYASACAMALLLLVALCSQTLSAPVSADPPTSCCFSYTAKKIPRHLVAKYYETSSRCSQPAVVFVTLKNREICANPTEKWVQDYMTYLEMN